MVVGGAIVGECESGSPDVENDILWIRGSRSKR